MIAFVQLDVVIFTSLQSQQLRNGLVCFSRSVVVASFRYPPQAHRWYFGIIYTFRSTIDANNDDDNDDDEFLCYTYRWVELKVEVLSRTSISSVLWAILLMRVNPLSFRISCIQSVPYFPYMLCMHFEACSIDPEQWSNCWRKRDSCIFFIINIYVYLKCCDMFFLPTLSIAVIISKFIFVWILTLYWASYFTTTTINVIVVFFARFLFVCTDKAYGIRMFTK